jgi:hypothetical protein
MDVVIGAVLEGLSERKQEKEKGDDDTKVESVAGESSND